MQMSVLLLAVLTNAIYDELRRTMACRKKGMPFFGFLALSPSTSPIALFAFIKSLYGKLGRGYAIQR